MKYQEFIQSHKRRMYALAYSILADQELSEQAARQGLIANGQIDKIMSLAVDPIITASILVKEAALELQNAHQQSNYKFSMENWTYTKQNALVPDFEELCEEDAIMLCLGTQKLDILLLCAQDGLTVHGGAKILNITSERAQALYDEAQSLLTELLTDDEEPDAIPDVAGCVKLIRERIAKATNENYDPEIFSANFEQSFLPVGIKKPNKEKSKLFRAAAIFAMVDAFAIIILISLTAWSGAFLNAPEREHSRIAPTISKENASNTEPLRTQKSASLYELSYEPRALPDGFRRDSHFFSEKNSFVRYVNDDGKFIIFKQQISDVPISGFNANENGLEPIRFNNHTAAFKTNGNVTDIFWYNERYSYTVSSNLPKDSVLHVAEGIKIGRGGVTSQTIPLYALPEIYMPGLAKENGDVVLDGDSIYNLEVLEKFYDEYTKGLDTYVRIIHYGKAGDARITDIDVQNGIVYATIDTHRDKNDDKMAEVGKTFSRITRTQSHGKQVLVLENDDDKFKVVSYNTEKSRD